MAPPATGLAPRATLGTFLARYNDVIDHTKFDLGVLTRLLARTPLAMIRMLPTKDPGGLQLLPIAGRSGTSKYGSTPTVV